MGILEGTAFFIRKLYSYTKLVSKLYIKHDILPIPYSLY